MQMIGRGNNLQVNIFGLFDSRKSKGKIAKEIRKWYTQRKELIEVAYEIEKSL